VPSNRAPQADAREAAHFGQPSRSRAAGRGRCMVRSARLRAVRLSTESLKTLVPFNYEPAEIARMLIHGKRHCGNISFSLAWEPDPAEIPARACTCSFCTKHGGVWTSSPSGSLGMAVKDPSLVSKYAFGTRTAEFHTCARCGVVAGRHQPDRRPSLRGCQRQRVRRR
jgi:hypothetical protein